MGRNVYGAEREGNTEEGSWGPETATHVFPETLSLRMPVLNPWSSHPPAPLPVLLLAA